MTFSNRRNRDNRKEVALGSFTFDLEGNHAGRPSVQTFDIQAKVAIDSLALGVSTKIRLQMATFFVLWSSPTLSDRNDACQGKLLLF